MRSNRDDTGFLVRIAATEIALAEVQAERARQHLMVARGEIAYACEDPATHDAYKLGVLMEEVGEVGKAVHEREDLRDLRKELIQVAAVAVAWAESLPQQ